MLSKHLISIFHIRKLSLREGKLTFELLFKFRTFEYKSSSPYTTQQGNVKDAKVFIRSFMQNIYRKPVFAHYSSWGYPVNKTHWIMLSFWSLSSRPFTIRSMQFERTCAKNLQYREEDKQPREQGTWENVTEFQSTRRLFPVEKIKKIFHRMGSPWGEVWRTGGLKM